MNRETSIYLDLVRFSAALAVFLSHLAKRDILHSFFWHFIGFGEPAVIVFFVLSGWVIAYTVDSRETSSRSYFIARAARIYSVAVPAIILTTVLDAIGSSYNPGLYSHFASVMQHPLMEKPLCLVFLNEAWNLNVAPGTDGPYWSLGYECMYYVLFGLFMFMSGRSRLFFLALVCLVVGPRVLSLVPIWLLGFGCYRLTRRSRIPFRLGAMMFAGSSAVILALATALAWGRLGYLSSLYDQRPLDVLIDYLLALLFAAHLLGAAAISDTFRWPDLVARSIRWLAGSTFSLYLYHLPILLFLSASLPFARDTWAFRLSLIGGALLAVFLLAEVTERRKAIWRSGFDRLAGLLSRRFS